MEEQLESIIFDFQHFVKSVSIEELSNKSSTFAQVADCLLERFEEQKILIKRRTENTLTEINCYQKMIVELKAILFRQ